MRSIVLQRYSSYVFPSAFGKDETRVIELN